MSDADTQQAVRPRILVVDDNDMNRDILCRRLERKGYDVTPAENGVRALELLGAVSFDLVLLDIMMPVVSGLDVLRSIRERFDPVELPVIMVTAKTGTDDIVEAFDLGASDYITKPVDFPVAFARIRMQLQLRFTELALKASEERYALSARGSNDGLWDVDLRRGVAYFSARWFEILGLDEGALAPELDSWFSRVHPEDSGLVRDGFRAHLAGLSPHFQSEHRIRHQDGEYRWVLCRGVAIRDESNVAFRAAGSMSDVTARRQIQQQLQQELISDSLTGLANQTMLFDRIESALVRGSASPSERWIVVLLELDDLSRTTEAHGSAVGDELLIEVSSRLSSCVEAHHKLARIATYRFAVLAEGITSADASRELVDELQRCFEAPFLVRGEPMFVSASCGYVVNDGKYEAPDELVRDAEVALRLSGERGVPVRFERAMHEESVALHRAATALREAIERGTVEMRYQPLVDTESGSWVGASADLVWPCRETRSMRRFDTHELGSMLTLAAQRRVDRVRLRLALREAAALRRVPGLSPSFFIVVRLSAGSLASPDFLAQYGAWLQEFVLDASAVRLAICHDETTSDPAVVAENTRALHQREVDLVLDRLGSTRSPLEAAADPPGRTLRLDGRLFQAIENSVVASSVVASVISAAAHDQLTLIVDGVTHPAHLDWIREQGAALAQGPAVGPEMTVSELQLRLSAPSGTSAR